MKKYSCIIIEDEIKSSEILKQFLKKYHPKIEVIGEAVNLKDAIDIIPLLNPDIVFLEAIIDNELSFSLFDYFDELLGEVIFITSHIEHSLKALKHGALDYILKPIKNSELIAAVIKAIGNINDKRELINLEKQLFFIKQHSNFIAIPSLCKIELIKATSILFCEADGRYTIFHFADGSTKIASKNIGEYEKQLHRNNFFRIHHRYLVNLEYVISIDKTTGNYCELPNKLQLPIARRRQDSFCKYLNLK
jgi:two-component system LytT family response regulator